VRSLLDPAIGGSSDPGPTAMLLSGGLREPSRDAFHKVVTEYIRSPCAIRARAATLPYIVFNNHEPHFETCGSYRPSE
jgi:hypothetical protein